VALDLNKSFLIPYPLTVSIRVKPDFVDCSSHILIYLICLVSVIYEHNQIVALFSRK